VGQEIPSFSPFLIDKLQMGMSDDNEIQSRTNRMDDAFCVRLRAAIDAGLESAPIGVVTTPGTQHPKLAGRYAAPQERGTAIDG
jgi:hypothetical protein